MIGRERRPLRYLCRDADLPALRRKQRVCLRVRALALAGIRPVTALDGQRV